MPETSYIAYIIGAAIGAAVGFILAWMALGKKHAVLEVQLTSSEEERNKIEAKAQELGVEVQSLLQNAARLESELESERKNIDKIQKQMTETFESISSKVSQQSQKSFLELAEESFKRLQEGAKKDQEQHGTAMKSLVEPVQKNLENLHKVVNDIEKQRHGTFSELVQNISLIREDHEKLRATTSSLAQALRSPTARGKWGEIHLQRALEAVGMLESVDFIQQDILRTDNSIQKPDVVIKLPGSRSIVIDAKTPIDAFLEAHQDGITEDQRKRALIRHAEQVRKHIKVLGSKAYWEKLDSPEFVLMYLPGDSYYAAALDKDPTLFEAGIENKVFLMTPSTLMPTLRVIEHAWKQEKLAQNAKEISALGNDLYKRLCTFGGHFDKMRRGLDGAIKSYDNAVGSLERSVMPVARKFRDLQAIGGDDNLAPLDPIGQTPRQLNAVEFGEADDLDEASEDKVKKLS